MRYLSLALLLSLPAVARGDGALAGLNSWARRTGVAPMAEPQRPDVGGDGYVEGTVDVNCPKIGGALRSQVLLSGDFRVRGPEGLAGGISVSGSSFLTGRCSFGGEASIDASVTVSGTGLLRSPSGASRRVEVEGQAPVQIKTSASRVHLRVYVTVQERLKP